MNIMLWVCQLFLALLFSYSGLMKSTQARERLVSIGQTGVDGLSYPLIRFIGITEILGALGIIVPWATHILPLLTPLAALGFSLIMVFAAPIHMKRKEFPAAIFNVFVCCMSIWVAYLRFSQLHA
ncbi:DoxX family protein [Rhodocytophaga rosea]|uniref:DoxX family protein n=1 Tax=Rhodocytophaga rosea TaxID=2704465 RepID=A0A6C0GMW6_9BACT|nr:DoxX family protein [Rhodocytophaga rosea]QHT68942.1 DoxX family protein [Rhodocytophaga rosea]